MKSENTLALIVAYYLSRYDRDAISSLGYRSWKEAFEAIGKILDVKPNTIKNMRDEFDPVHKTERVGWYQRSLPPSRASVVSLLDGLEEQTLKGVVCDL